jgi:hypothetical protein
MPIEFDEYKIGEQRFSPTGRPLGKVVAKPKENTSSPLLSILIKLKLAKDEDHAKFILLIIIIVAFGLAIFFSIKSYQYLTPEINTAPIDLNQI